MFCLSASVRPSAGTAISAEAPPDSRTSSVSSEPSEAATWSARRPACSLPAVGIGWPPTIISNGAANCAPASATLVGDSPQDLRAARAAGFGFVFADYGYGKVDAAELGSSPRIARFAEIDSLID